MQDNERKPEEQLPQEITSEEAVKRGLTAEKPKDAKEQKEYRPGERQPGGKVLQAYLGGNTRCELFIELAGITAPGTIERHLYDAVMPLAIGDRRDVWRLAQHMQSKGGAKATAGVVLERLCWLMNVLDKARRDGKVQRPAEQAAEAMPVDPAAPDPTEVAPAATPTEPAAEVAAPSDVSPSEGENR